MKSHLSPAWAISTASARSTTSKLKEEEDEKEEEVDNSLIISLSLLLTFVGCFLAAVPSGSPEYALSESQQSAKH